MGSDPIYHYARSFSKWGLTPFNLMQVLARGARVTLERALGLLLLRSLVFPLAIEEIVDERRHLGDFFLLELAREDRGDVFHHAAALRLVDRLRRRADEEQLRLLLAVLVIDGDIHFDRLVAKRADGLERGFECAVEAAADLAGPADVEDQFLLVELEARLVLLEALHIGEAIGVQVLEQRRERLLELPPRDAFENRDIGVGMYFVPHCANLRGGCRILPLKSGHATRL